MRRSGRAVGKQPQQSREAKKPKQKKTLEEECRIRITALHDAVRDRAALANKEKYREAEDEVLRMVYGPNWRTLDLPHDPKPSKVAVNADVEDAERKAG